jgi:hypothetical protein
MKNRGSSVGIALGYGLDDRCYRVRFLAEAGNFFHYRVQNDSRAHSAFYPMGTGCSFPGGKAAGAWNWPLISVYCRGRRMSGGIAPLPHYAFMAFCSVKKKAQGQLYLYCNYMSDIVQHASATSYACRDRWKVCSVDGTERSIPLAWIPKFYCSLSLPNITVV